MGWPRASPRTPQVVRRGPAAPCARTNEGPVPHKHHDKPAKTQEPSPPTSDRADRCREHLHRPSLLQPGRRQLGLQQGRLGPCSRHTKAKTLEGGQARGLTHRPAPTTAGVSALSRGSRRLELGSSSGDPSWERKPNQNPVREESSTKLRRREATDMAESGQAWPQGAVQGGVGGPATSRPRHTRFPRPQHLLPLTRQSQGTQGRGTAALNNPRRSVRWL